MTPPWRGNLCSYTKYSSEMNKRILRTIDANANRLTEGLRVCEDITRFILLDKKKTQKFKSLRHKAHSVFNKFDAGKTILLESRNAKTDIVSDIFKANIKRAEESARVLEEFSKLGNKSLSESFKNMRFELYSLEKSIVKKL